MSRAALSHPAARLSAFYAAIFLVAGIQLPFWPIWLAARGLTAREIGIVLAAAIWAKVLATPAIGAIAVGAMVIGRLRVLEARIEKLSIGILTVDHLKVRSR